MDNRYGDNIAARVAYDNTLGMNFFIPNICVGFGRSEQS
jgi:hypothetical protein